MTKQALTRLYSGRHGLRPALGRSSRSPSTPRASSGVRIGKLRAEALQLADCVEDRRALVARQLVPFLLSLGQVPDLPHQRSISRLISDDGDP